MTSPEFQPREVWVSEHYWPGVAAELVLAMSQRLAVVPGWAASIVLPAQQTAFGLYVGQSPGDIGSALTRAGLPGGAIDPGLQITRALTDGFPTHDQEVGT
jgi:hypothetical protein